MSHINMGGDLAYNRRTGRWVAFINGYWVDYATYNYLVNLLSLITWSRSRGY